VEQRNLLIFYQAIYFTDMNTSSTLFYHLLQLAMMFLALSRADQEIEGDILLHVQHSFDLGKSWQDRGTVNIHNTRTGASSHDQAPLLPDQKAALQAQCDTQGLYMVKIAEQKSGSMVGQHRSYTSACSMLESGMMDMLTLNTDWRGNLLSVALGVQQQPNNKYSKAGIRLDIPTNQDNMHFKTKVQVQNMEAGPVPDTAAFIQKMEEEKRKAEKGEVKDNRSFLAKYWMYIVPIVLFMAINGAAAPEGGQ